MKKIVLLLFLFGSLMCQAQIVAIPDTNFMSKLLQADPGNSIAYSGGLPVKIDTNLDGNIQESEALVIDSLNVSFASISNLLGIQSFSNLKKLSCQSNSISGTLELNALNQLIYIDFGSNQISDIMMTNAANLKTVYGSFNLLTTIDLSQSNMIERLSLSSNNLTELTLDNLSQLKSLDCAGNQIESLNCNNNSNLEYLAIQSPILKYLFIKNGVDESTTMDQGSWFELFCCNPNLEYVCCDAMQYENVLSVIEQFQLFNCQVNTYCYFTPGGDYNTISGETQFDLDNNGCDASDFSFPFMKIDINIDAVSTNSSVFSNENGFYQIFTDQTGTYELIPDLENPTYFNVTPNPAVVFIADIDNSTTTQNFCVTANGVHPDLEVVIEPINPARPGFEAVYQIVYRNIGNQVLSQIDGITFLYNDNVMDFSSATLPTSSSSIGSLSWDYSNLNPFESRAIQLTFQVNTPTNPTFPVNINDIFNFTASILAPTGDENPSNNQFVFNQTVVGSYDPNDITCLQGNVVPPSEIGNYLHYNIRFENTGTAPAEFVVVKVEVNQTDFDMNSLQIMNSSDPVYARINQNIVEFIFQNIQLESGGHGNILLKIKSKNNLLVGDEVNKKANIYFDYNFPILTNDAETVFQSLNNPDFQNDSSISVYPNPTNGIVTVNCNNSIKSIQLYDVQGRLLQTNLVNENETTIDVSTKAKGVYFLKILSDKGMKVEKIVRE